MPVNPHIFREFSIRGIAERDLTEQVVVAIGRAIGAFFASRGGRTLVVGRDVRQSSPQIGSWCVAGLLTAGVDVVDVGQVPTPVHNFATDWYGADGGIMVTASHNPPEYNGLKLRADRTLHGGEVQEIYQLAAASSRSPDRAGAPGQWRQADPLPAYLERVAARARLRRRLRVAVDGGNGTNGPLATRLLEDLGCQVIPLHIEPDGAFPGRGPDPTAPGALRELAARARAEGADLGLAYDGDGDRLAVVDEQGQPVPGDQALMLLARDVLRRGPAKIVYEILCSQALADDVAAHGGEPVLAPSGYAFVHAAMLASGAALGGEYSGHLFFDTPGFRFDDSILGSLRLLNLLSGSRASLSALVADLPAYHSSPQIRIPCPDAIKSRVVERVKRHYQAKYPVDELDGARVNFGDGWALVRASNTQPALSLRFEATSQSRMEQLQAQVLEQVEHWIRHLERNAEANADSV
jgi:phosphomannomutase/phosphoglucomutase